LYLGIFNQSFPENLLNSYFESVSSITTTGFSLLQGKRLPKSLVLQRSLNKWVGGIGIVFILLSFFYPSRSLFHYGRIIGIEKLTSKYKKTFLIVLGIYLVFTLFFSVSLTYLGREIFSSLILTLSTISTGGIEEIPSDPNFLLVLLLAMLSSSISYSFFFNLLHKKVDLQTSEEVLTFFALLFLFSMVFWKVSKLSLLDSFFSVASSLSSTGMNKNILSLNLPSQIILIFCMLIGPCSLSVGGGIKISRVQLFLKTLISLPRIFFKREEIVISVGGKEFRMNDILLNFLIITLFLLTPLLSSILFTFYGYSFFEGFFESTSALTTTGLSVINISTSFPNTLKLLLIFLMVFGRVEFIPFFLIFFKEKSAGGGI